ncbi:alpha/beta hydrolase family protein [Fictibacillus sp. FJAT-27399]|uniref:alpha/beta hydrolase family protein n=1 Tax=Fictibacillus sp. FJAT-27399 TaxID=1729689 RepID=UPI00078401C3|nr:S9 family peptidase [Fictibacillus sp. FJAT-27399]
MLPGISAEDLYRLKFVSDPQVSPDGEKVAYTVKRINKDKNYESHLYICTLSSGATVQWTRGSHNDTSPRWSPDGKLLSFVSDRSGKNQIWLISAEGGEAEQLTSNEGSASSPVWSPDGKSLLAAITVKKETDGVNRLRPLEVTELQYKADGRGMLKGEYSQLFLIDRETRNETKLTSGLNDHFGAAWSPDGDKIAYSKSRANEDTVSYASDLVIQQLGGEEKIVSHGTGAFTDPVWSADGEYLAYFGQTFEHGSATLGNLHAVHLDSSVTICLTKNFDEHAGDAVIGDMHYGHAAPKAAWSKDRKGLYFIATLNGNSSLHYATLEGVVSQITNQDCHLYGCAVDSENDYAIFAASSPVIPGDLFYASLSNLAEEVRLTDVNSEVLSEIVLSHPEEFRFTNDEGNSVQSWLLKPPGFEEGKKYPLVLEIHGGPHGMYGNTFFHELQMLAASGYVVLYSNPRGSYGYGQQFVKACMGDYGGGDYRDLMAAVDYVLSHYDFVDMEQLVVTGGSYGGFMTNWIIGRTSRFKAAVTQRSISNWLSFYGVSDIGFYFTKWEVGYHLFEDPEKLWQHSPLRLSSRMDTPLLILHGEEDYRCPIEQAEQLFIALKQQDKKVKFVRFPKADHNLSRNGDPGLRVARLQYIVSWFDQQLEELENKGGAILENAAADRV